ncbi:MAG: AMIN domain-containing protein [Clostridiales bacterium]|nr:MAG: AMIN domain-containing protein [Clostridiales bacterium]
MTHSARRWNGTAQKQVSIKKDDSEILLTVGVKTAYVNSKAVSLDCAPTIISDRCMVPIRFISETLGCNVKWDDKTKSVLITYNMNNNDTKNENPVISDIKLAQNADDKSVFEIAYNSTKEPNVFFLSYSNCIVMDFANTSLAFADSKVTIDNTFVKEIRYAQHEDYARVVIECKNVQPYTTSLANGIFTVNVGSASTAVITPSNPVTPENPQEPDVTMTDREFTKTRNENNLCVVIDAGHGGKDPRRGLQKNEKRSN